LAERSVVRAHLMRNTVHLVTAADFIAFRPLFQVRMVRPPGSAPPGSAPPDPARAVEQFVLRYLAAYGPASVADIQAWSGLTRLREVTERLGAALRPVPGPSGADLLDLPDAPRPGPDVPAPPRFLPEYDNLLLSFADRSRVIPHGRPVPLPPGNGASGGTLLVDGRWQADWKITASPGRAVLDVMPFTGSAPVTRTRSRPKAPC